MKNLSEYILEALKKGVKVKMRNAIEGRRGKYFDAEVLCDEFKVPGNETDFEGFVFIRLKDKPSYLPTDVQLAIYNNDDNDWTFDPTFWECVGDDIKYYEKALAQAGLKAVWNERGYYNVVSK